MNKDKEDTMIRAYVLVAIIAITATVVMLLIRFLRIRTYLWKLSLSCYFGLIGGGLGVGGKWCFYWLGW